MNVIRPIVVTDAMLTASNVPETDYSEWNAATNYTVGDFSIRTTAATHKVYRNLIAGVNATPPEDAPTRWQDYSPTNRWAAFDKRTGTQTEQATSITYRLVPGATVNSVAFINLSAASVRIVMTDPTDGVVYDETVSATVASLSGDWDSFFFDYITRKSDVVVQNLPTYPLATLDITISEASGTAKVGVVAIGRSIELGDAQHGASFGIVDYSRKEADEFGGYTIVQRAFAKRATFDIVVEKDVVDAVATLLAELRSTPAVWVGSTEYQGTIIYGFYKDFDVVIAYPTWCDCSIEIEGLT